MEIPDTWATLVLSAVNDAILHNQAFLTSETIADKTDWEEHLMQLSLLLEFLKADYRNRLEPKGSIPLARFLPDQAVADNVLPLRQE